MSVVREDRSSFGADGHIKGSHWGVGVVMLYSCPAFGTLGRMRLRRHGFSVSLKDRGLSIRWRQWPGLELGHMEKQDEVLSIGNRSLGYAVYVAIVPNGKPMC
jgi:hypothetical protein